MALAVIFGLARCKERTVKLRAIPLGGFTPVSRLH